MHSEPTSETGVVELLKRLRSTVCCDSRCNLRRVLPIYQRLLSPHKDPVDNSVERNLLNIRAKMLTCSEYTDIIDIVGRMDHVTERWLSLAEKLQQHNVQVAVPMEEVMRLLVALAGGEDGETFVLVDTVQLYDARNKRMGERIGMTGVEMVRRSRSLFCQAPVPLGEKAFLSQNLFNGFGNGISRQHVSLWCPDARIFDDKELLNIMSDKLCNRFFSLPGTPPAQIDIAHGLVPSYASPCMKSTRHVKHLPPWSEVFSYDSTQEAHCGAVQQTHWEEASSMTKDSSWYSDCSRDTTEPWVARTYAWEDLGDRIGLPEDYCRPPIGEVKRSLHDLVISNEFASKSHTKEMLLEVHEVDLIEDSLRALSGIDSTTFRRHFQSATFQLPGKQRLKLRNTTVSATLSVLKVFCKAGTTLMRLELLAIYYSQDSSRGGKTLQAMGDALQLYLSTHRAFVERITQQCLPSPKMGQEDEVVSVTKLVCKTRKLCSVLEFVGHVFGCDEDVFWPLLQQDKFPHGVALLDRLHHHVSSLRVEDAAGHVHELAIWFLVKAFSPLLAALSDLILSGRVDQATDPFDEFRITTWSRHLIEKAAARGGDGLFSDDLSADAIQILPAFLKNVAPLVVQLSQVQALLRSVNAITSTHPLANMQPLSIYTCSSKATEHAEEWQSVFAEAMAYREDITLSTETRKSTSKMPFEATEEQRQCFVPEDVKANRSSQLQQKNMLDQQILKKKYYYSQLDHEKNANNEKQGEEAKEAEADQEACGHGGFLNEYSALMISAQDTIGEEANEETGAWTLAPRSKGSSSMKVDKEEESRRETSTDNCGTRQALVEVNNVLENCSSISANSDTWRASGEVNTQSGSRGFGISKSPASTVMASRKACVRILNEPGGIGTSMYETLYGGSDEMPTPKDIFQQNGTDNCVAASMTDDVGMEESSPVMDITTDSIANEPPAEVTVDKDVRMQDVAHDEERSARWRSDCGKRLSSKASGYVGEVPLQSTQVLLPPIHPFFSMAIPQEDSEVLTRALTENSSEVNFTSFSSIVDSCVEMPVRLVLQRLEQVAVDWFRNSLQVLEHLRWLRKLMLVSEGLCMDIFARDFLRGLNSTTRVNWGVDDRLSSALTLAMIEASVSMNVIAQNFHYKTTAALSRVLTSLTMTPVVPSLLNEFELVYDVKWPLGLVITSRSLNDYKQMHRFLLHVRLTSLETREMWAMLRTIRQKRKLSQALERLCGGVVYKMQAFLQAFNETFATKVLMSAWSELEYASEKATTLTELRRCHEEYVSVALCCCFLDTSVIAIRSAISATLAAAWKLTGFIRSLDRQVAERASDDSCMRVLCGQLDVTLGALVGCLRNATRDAEQNTRKFSEVRKLFGPCIFSVYALGYVDRKIHSGSPSCRSNVLTPALCLHATFCVIVSSPPAKFQPVLLHRGYPGSRSSFSTARKSPKLTTLSSSISSIVHAKIIKTGLAVVSPHCWQLKKERMCILEMQTTLAQGAFSVSTNR